MTSFRNFAVFVGLFVAVLFVGYAYGDSLKEVVVTPAASAPTTSTLKVEPALDNKPKPIDYNLQGSRPGGQEAAGDLQMPQTTDQLQPNAKLRDFPANN